MRTIHVAILDDDPSIRVALGRLLKSAGMDAHAYASSDQLFAALALKLPDCLLVDLQMRGMSGLEILRYFAERHIRIPTIVLTGHDTPGSRAACLNAGASAYLHKPVDADQLIGMIEEVCGSSEPGALSSGS